MLVGNPRLGSRPRAAEPRAVTRSAQPQPAQPREAATLVLVRERQPAVAGPEVLLVQRHGQAAFAASAYVFPGGVLEASDCVLDPAQCATAAVQRNAERMQEVRSVEHAAGFQVAAVRETFEEIGILLARDAAGNSWQPTAGAGSAASAGGGERETQAEAEEEAALLQARGDLRQGRLDFQGWLRGRGLLPAIEELVYFAHWVTPQGRPKRFSARFFVAPWPAGQMPRPDQVEIVGSHWFTPQEAIAAYQRGEVRMVGATVRNLELLATFADTRTMLASLASREVGAVLPKLTPGADGKPRPVYPWEAEYDSL